MVDGPDSDVKMPLLDHLVELRKRLMWSFITLIVLTFAFYGVAEHIYQFLVSPLAHAYEELGAKSPRMIFTALHEAFFTYIKVAFFAAAFVSFPVFATQLWIFVAPGLYKHEKSAFAPFLIATPILFLAGGAFVYYFVMPVAWRFVHELLSFWVKYFTNISGKYFCFCEKLPSSEISKMQPQT